MTGMCCVPPDPRSTPRHRALQPTNPQADDITATGHCEYWITTIDLMEYQEKSTLSSPDDTMLPEVYTDTVACIYNVDGTCNGMLTPEYLNIL